MYNFVFYNVYMHIIHTVLLILYTCAYQLNEKVYFKIARFRYHSSLNIPWGCTNVLDSAYLLLPDTSGSHKEMQTIQCNQLINRPYMQ